MNLFEQLLNRETKLSVIGLGYVGLPIAVAFSRSVEVIGFDINKEKIDLYREGIDPTKEIGDKALKESTTIFTCDEGRIREAKFHIIAVPTPINEDKTPNLEPIISASKIVGRNLQEGSIVTYESTVYPGVTEDICVPLLERHSGLKCGTDFKVGYSPERINPGDKLHRLETITKVVSGMDEDSLNIIDKVYSLVAKSGTYRAKSIKVAEAAKVIENSQRDINIAFMNELSIIFNKLGIDTKDVLEAASTKWNFLSFQPGLVGGHCIGVDPYYLTYKAEQAGYRSQVILSGRRINDDMGRYIVENLVKKMSHEGINVGKARVAILGITFKENCPDTRNSRVIDIIDELKEYGINPRVHDPIANPNDVLSEYGIKLVDMNELEELDAIIISVAHDEYKKLTKFQLNEMYKKTTKGKVIFDVKGILNKKELLDAGYHYWRL